MPKEINPEEASPDGAAALPLDTLTTNQLTLFDRMVNDEKMINSSAPINESARKIFNTVRFMTDKQCLVEQARH